MPSKLSSDAGVLELRGKDGETLHIATAKPAATKPPETADAPAAREPPRPLSHKAYRAQRKAQRAAPAAPAPAVAEPEPARRLVRGGGAFHEVGALL